MATTRLGSIVPMIGDETQVRKSGQDGNEIKFGVNCALRDSVGGELVLLYPHESIFDAVKKLCDKWGFPDPSMFALRFGDADKIGHYVTEEVRKHLTGKIIAMDYSATKISVDVMEKLKSSEATMLSGLKDLADRASDPTLAETFIEKNGLTCLVELIEKDKITQEQALLYTFQALLDIIFSSNTISWDQMPGTLFAKVATYVNTPKGVAQDRLALKPALQILESAISCENAASQRVEADISLPTLINHISHPDPHVQLSSLSLINTLLQKADVTKRKLLTATLNSKKYRCIIHERVVNRPGEMLCETRHQLYVLQTLLLTLLEERKLSTVDQDSEALNRIKDLCHTPPYEADGNHVNSGSTSDLVTTGSFKKEKPNFTKDYKRLGFQNEVNPSQDFAETPPGILALDCMHYLAKQHSDTYNKLVLECGYRGTNDDGLLPFARASIQLAKVLAELLKVGEQPSEVEGRFYPFYFTHDKPFEELYCVCIQLVLKTWKEMRATSEDFQKVFDVVRDQIRRSLVTFPVSFPKLQAKLNSLTFAEITSLRARERSSREEGELQLQPIQELQNKIMPEVLELVKQNRMNFLISGTRFNKFTSKSLVSASATTLKRVKEKYWFCRLSSNWKVLHYGDCEEKANPTPEELSNKISIVDLKELLVGKECPHTKEKKNRNLPYAFSLVIEKEPLQSIDFIAPDEKVFDLWTDGINALLGKPMSSKEAKNDIEILLKMEVKLRLLDIEGIEIPNEPPPIPPPPINFDFSVLL